MGSIGGYVFTTHILNKTDGYEGTNTLFYFCCECEVIIGNTVCITCNFLKVLLKYQFTKRQVHHNKGHGREHASIKLLQRY